MRTVEVQTPSAQYQVHVGAGLLPAIAAEVGALARGRVFVLTSPPVWDRWGEPLLRAFPQPPTLLFLPPGEPHKRLSEVARLLEEMAQAGADRSSVLLAFGGGIVGDIGGFVAAIYMRGIRYVGVPTTLLAQVDSSVGGKTGANLLAGKNLVGAFHHPASVWADVSLLSTLPPRELRAGLMEVVKAAIIRDATLFALLEQQLGELLDPQPNGTMLEEIVARSVAIKAEVVGIDELELGLRMILNLGHTVGHAIEAATGYSALLHGEAVGWGMLVALSIAQGRGLVSQEEEARAGALIRALGPLPGFRADAETLLATAGRDKKNAGGTRRFVLPRGLGDAVVVEDVTDRELLAATEGMLREATAAMGAEVPVG